MQGKGKRYIQYISVEGGKGWGRRRDFVCFGCKGTIWFLNPKGKRIQAQRAQYNEFVENGLENQALMSWVTIIMDPDNNKVKIN